MKRYLVPLLFSVTSLITFSANAGYQNTFTPNKPTVSAPIDQASDVALSTEFTSSDFAFTENNPDATDPTLSTSNWIVSKKSNGITLLDGEISSLGSQTTAIQYVIPFPITISGQVASKINIPPNPTPSAGTLSQPIELLSSTGSILATASIGIPGFTYQANSKFVIVKETANTLLLQWHISVSQLSTDGIIEFILVDGGFESDNSAKVDFFGWRSSINDLNLALFSSQISGPSCGISADGTAAPTVSTSVSKTLAEWKTYLVSEGETKFSLGCSSKPVTNSETTFNLNAGPISDVDVDVDVDSLLPSVTVISSDSGSYTLNSGEALNLNTEYMVQVQHIAESGQLTGASSWSSASSFTTRLANTNYQVTIPTDLAFTAGQAKDLAFKVSNTGPEAGAPKVTIRLPFKAHDVVNGPLSDFFNVSIDGQNCTMTEMGEKTDFTCQLDSLAAAAELQLTAKITAKDASVKTIEYQVCDAEKCDTTDFTTVDITVAAPADLVPTNPASETTSSSSSSGGSMFWLFLMTPLLLLRRKK